MMQIGYIQQKLTYSLLQIWSCLDQHMPNLLQQICTNKFWSQVLNSWGKLQSRIEMNSINNALSSPLWYNPKISKAHLYLPHWYKKGIICLGDMQ